MELKTLLEELMTELHKVSQTSTLVGKPFVLGNTRMVPLCKLTLGFGTGTTDASGAMQQGRGGDLEAAGAGGALSVEPRAFVVIGPDGVPQMLSMRGKRAVLQHAIELGATPEDDPDEGYGT